MELGCGLFGLAFELEKDFWGTFRKLSEMGFTAVEPLYAFPNDFALSPESPVPSFVKGIMWDEEKVSAYMPELEKLGLEISSMHVGFMFGKSVEEGIADLIRFSEKSGIRNFMTSLEFDTKKKAQDAAKLLNTAAELLRDTDIRLGYHNHFQEFGKCRIGEKEMTLMEYFLSITDSDVMLQIDTGWQMYGGDDVPAFLKKYGNRILSVHLKDFVKHYESIAQEDAFAVIGEGMLPVREIQEILPELRLMKHGVMIDQDRPAKGSVLSEDLKKGIQYLIHK